MNKTAIIDYDAGNTQSVLKALEYLGANVELTGDINHLVSCDRVIFPGVGAYFDAMNKLKSAKLEGVIKELISKDIPFLGICLGMQLLFDYSEETIGAKDTNKVEGLHILPGEIKQFSRDLGLKIPHMGWNSVKQANKSSVLFKDIPDESYFYFVHSFYLNAKNKNEVAATSVYGHEFDCAVEKDNVFGCQFHPEKSGETGLLLLKNFCTL